MMIRCSNEWNRTNTPVKVAGVLDKIFSETSLHLILRQKKSLSLVSKRGEKETVASNFTDWVNVIFNGLDYFTGHKLAYAWRTGHGLQFNERLCPIKPFVIGGDYKPDNLYAIESSKNIKTNANIARQIYDRPNGTPITIKVINSGKEK